MYCASTIRLDIAKKYDFMMSAILATGLAWFAGLFLDANFGFEPLGFLELRILFPIIVMGCFILKKLDKKDK